MKESKNYYISIPEVVVDRVLKAFEDTVTESIKLGKYEEARDVMYYLADFAERVRRENEEVSE